MITFRCTAKTLKRFRLEPEDNPPEPCSVLGDWYVNLLNVGPQRLVLCVSEKSLLPVILPARKAEFPGNFPSYLHAVLCATNVPAELAAIEAESANEYTIARTDSRSVLGVMNDFANMAQYFLAHESPFEASLRLSETPCKPTDYDSPAMRTRELFSTRAYQPRRAP